MNWLGYFRPNSSLYIPHAENITESHLKPLSQISEEELQAIWDEANREAEEAVDRNHHNT